MAYNNKKVGDIFGCHITFFVLKQSTFNSPNHQYLEIFGFNQIDFVSAKRMQELFSIPQSQWSVSSFQKINKNKQLRQILRYITTVAIFKK